MSVGLSLFPVDADARYRPMPGIVLKLGGTVAFALMYTAIRLAEPVPTGEVIFFRSFFALIPVMVLGAQTIGLKAMTRTARPWLHVRRALLGVTAMSFNFMALTMLPLADFTAFGFAMPIFAVILSVLVLKEQVGLYRWSAVTAGLIGVTIMLTQHGGLSGVLAHGVSSGALLALIGAFVSAVVVIQIRQMHASEHGQTIIFYFMLTCSAVGAISMVFDHAPLTVGSTAWLVLSGLLGGIGQIGMTFSYRYAEPSLLAPFDYVSMIWAVLLGWFVFAEMPDAIVMLGAGIVIAAGLFIVWRERQLTRLRAATTEPAL